MTLTSLKERLARYLRNNHGWIASGDLQRLAAERTSYSPQNVGRRLRELAAEGILEVQLRKVHAFYRAKEIRSPLELASASVAWFENL